MSAAKIISQGNPQQIIGLPTVDFRLPVMLHVRMQIGAAGAPTLVFARDTTTGWLGTTVDTTVVLSATGTYDFVFNPCRGFALGTFEYLYVPNSAGTDRFDAVVDKNAANTNATTGKLRLVTNTTGTAAAATPNANGAEIHFSLWADLG